MNTVTRYIVYACVAIAGFFSFVPSPVHAMDGFVKVTSPNGGETLKVGDTYTITWDTSPNIDKVAIGYSFGPGSLNWIQFDGPNTKSYSWKVNVGNTTNTKIKIEVIAYETGKGSVTDQSDDYVNLDGVHQIPTSAPRATSTPGSSSSGIQSSGTSSRPGTVLIPPMIFPTSTPRPIPTKIPLTYQTLVIWKTFQFDGSHTTDLSKVTDLTQVKDFTLDTKEGFQFTFTDTLNFRDPTTLAAMNAIADNWTYESWFVWIHIEWWVTYRIQSPIQVTYNKPELTGFTPIIEKVEERNGTRIIVTPKPSTTPRPAPQIAKSSQGAVVLALSDATPIKIVPQVILDGAAKENTSQAAMTLSGKTSHSNLVFQLSQNGTETTVSPKIDPKTGTFTVPVTDLVEGVNYLELRYRLPEDKAMIVAGKKAITYRKTFWERYGTTILMGFGAIALCALGFFGRGLLEKTTAMQKHTHLSKKMKGKK